MLNDLYAFDISTQTWANLTANVQGDIPSPRAGFGFVASGQRLFVFGGYQGLWLLGMNFDVLTIEITNYVECTHWRLFGYLNENSTSKQAKYFVSLTKLK